MVSHWKKSLNLVSSLKALVMLMGINLFSDKEKLLILNLVT